MADLLNELERFEQEMKELGSEPSSSTLSPLPHMPHVTVATPPPLPSPLRPHPAGLPLAVAHPSLEASTNMVGASGGPISSTPVHSTLAKPSTTLKNPNNSTPIPSCPSPGLASPASPMPWLKNGAHLSAAPTAAAVAPYPSSTTGSSSQFTFLSGNSPFSASVSVVPPQAPPRSMLVSSSVNYYARASSQHAVTQPQQYNRYHNQPNFQSLQPQQLPLQPTAAQAPQHHYQALYQSTPEVYHPQQQQAQQLFQKDAQTITPEALEHVKAALASGDGEQKSEAKRKAVPRKAAGQKWEDPTLADWPENDYRLFCGDLGNEVNDEVLTKAFSHFPTFNMARVVRDKRTGKTKGFGFVSFALPSDLASALKEMNGKYVGNRPIKLRKSTWKERTDFEAYGKQKTAKKLKMSKKNVLHK